MDSEAKNVDITKTEDELEIEIRHKLFDALVEDYDVFGGVGQRNKIKIDSSLLNRDEFLFGCKGHFRQQHLHQAWFFYFINKIVIIHIPNDGTYRNVQEYFKVYKYGSHLNYVSIYDVAKIVFRHLTVDQLEEHQFQPHGTCENTNNFSLDLDLDIDKLIYSGGQMQKWFHLDSFQFEKHINNGYICDWTGWYRGLAINIVMTIRSHIRKMIEKNEQKRMQDLIQELKYEQEDWSIYYGNQFEDIESQFEKQSKIVSLQESQITNMNGIILSMQIQIEEQSKIIVNQQSKMEGIKKIMTNMLREQQSMSRQLEEQSKIIESLQEKKKIEQLTLDTDIDLILNGEI